MGTTSVSKALISYIDINMDGLQETVADLITREKTLVNMRVFQNDMGTFATKDDVLTLTLQSD